MAPYTLNDGGWTVIKVTVTLMILDLIFLVLRFIARRKVKASFGADDIWAILAFIFFLGNVSMDYWSMILGQLINCNLLNLNRCVLGWCRLSTIDVHLGTNDCKSSGPFTHMLSDQVADQCKADYVSSWLNLMNVLCVKLSVLCLYRRIFETAKFRRFTFWFGIVVAAIMILMMIAGAFRCIPVQSIWDPRVKSNVCLNYLAGFVAGFTLNTITDVILLAMPFVMIRSLQMPVQKKLELVGIFLLGIGTCIASILRITSTYSKDPVEGESNQPKTFDSTANLS